MRPIPNCLLSLSIIGLLSLGACQGPQATSQPKGLRAIGYVEGASTAKPEFVPAVDAASHQDPEQHAPRDAVGSAPVPNGSAPNRDLHGPKDTAKYVEMLQSDERIRELKPDLVAKYIYESANLAPDSVVGDIGCGPGIFVWPIAKRIPDGFVFAVDVEPAQLDALRAGLIERKIENAVPVLASYTTPHLPAQSCDAIFIADTYHHFEDRVAYMGLLRTRLKPGGFLVLLEYKDGELPVGPPAKHKVLKTDRHDELRKAGFELDQELSTHIFHDFEFWRVRRAGK